MADLLKVMEREGVHSEHAAQCVLEARRRDNAKKKTPIDEGELWSWVRSVMSQGADIRCDYDQGVHKGYEAYSARLDAAAAERSQELWARLNPHNTTICSA